MLFLIATSWFRIQVFLLCLLAGCSICWFNTVCYVICIRNFPTNRPLALSLTISFNGVSAALYTLIANAINPNDNTVYLFLNALLPLITYSVALITLIANAINPNDNTVYLFLNALLPLITYSVALIPVLRQPPLQSLSANATRQDSVIFLCLYILAVITGLYLLLLNSLSSNSQRAQILLVGAIFLLALPFCLPGVTYAREWARRNILFRSNSNTTNINLVEHEDDDQSKELISGTENTVCGTVKATYSNGVGIGKVGYTFFRKVMEKDKLTMLGEEHPARVLVRRWDFWLYYMAYFCGGTIGLVYSNNLGQISQSLGYSSLNSSLVTLYSSCSFFGRLLSASPDFLRNKVYFARTGWLAVALVPTPIAFLLLATSGSEAALRTGTALIGLSSGFVFSAAVSITSELFGPNSAGVNHNILITNIPIGSLLYGLLAALVYDSNEGNSIKLIFLKDTTLCMGRKCYQQTFIWWGCISIVGLVSSFLLFLRTRQAYVHFDRTNSSHMQCSSS